MTQHHFWEYDEYDRIYLRHFGRSVARVWQDADGLWDAMIESGRRNALRNGFMSYDEAQTWVIQYVEDMTALERRVMLRAS